MDLISLHYFQELSKDLNMTKTAERLYISQQTLSNHIQRLEQYYNAPLFYRKPSLSLTCAGEFVLGFALHFFLNRQTTTTHHELQHQIHVPTGQHVEIMLADGSKVWLNSGSTLTFPSKFNGKKRLVELDGEGFFEVKSDKEHPFIVSTSKYQVKAVGTSFNVYDYQDSPQFEAALLNGKVEVTTNAKKSSAVILTPNQRAALCQGVLKVKPIENTNNYLWRKGILYFNEPLLEVFDKLQEYYDVEFQIRNTSLTRKSPYCTGKFRAKDGLEHIIRVLKETNHFDYQIDYENKKIIIL